MAENRNAPGAGVSARGPNCLPERAGNFEVSENQQFANGIELTARDGEVLSIAEPGAKLLRRLALAGSDGLRLVGAELTLAHALYAQGVPLRSSALDPKGREYVALALGLLVSNVVAR